MQFLRRPRWCSLCTYILRTLNQCFPKWGSGPPRGCFFCVVLGPTVCLHSFAQPYMPPPGSMRVPSLWHLYFGSRGLKSYGTPPLTTSISATWQWRWKWRNWWFSFKCTRKDWSSQLYSVMEKSPNVHYFFIFSLKGNKLTLETRPSRDGVDIRQELLTFHSTYYSSNLMGLCVLGRGKTSSLTNIVFQYYKILWKPHSALTAVMQLVKSLYCELLKTAKRKKQYRSCMTWEKRSKALYFRFYFFVKY